MQWAPFYCPVIHVVVYMMGESSAHWSTVSLEFLILWLRSPLVHFHRTQNLTTMTNNSISNLSHPSLVFQEKTFFDKWQKNHLTLNKFDWYVHVWTIFTHYLSLHVDYIWIVKCSSHIWLPKREFLNSKHIQMVREMNFSWVQVGWFLIKSIFCSWDAMKYFAWCKGHLFWCKNVVLFIYHLSSHDKKLIKLCWHVNGVFL